jgi:hypothetical protein
MSAIDAWIEDLPLSADNHRILLRSTAERLARQSPIGWYIAPHGEVWVADKMTIALIPEQRYLILDDATTHPLQFGEVEAALVFFRDRLGLYRIATFAE